MAETARTYHIGIVGEASYQRAIGACRVGDSVILFAEMNNPFDDEAVVVKSTRNETIGYLGRDHWLRDALLHEGAGCSATIAELRKVAGKTAVVLLATMNESKLRSCGYIPSTR